MMKKQKIKGFLFTVLGGQFLILMPPSFISFIEDGIFFGANVIIVAIMAVLVLEKETAL